MGMGVYVVVGQGLEQFICMFVMYYKGVVDFDLLSIVLIGKGIIFDIGGIILKKLFGM